VSLELAAAILREDPAGASAEVNAVLNAEPQNTLAYVLLGELQFRAKQYDLATATLSRPSVLNSRYPQVRLFLGLIDAAKGRTDGALDNYKKSLILDPSYTPSRLALAGMLLRRGLVSDARVELQEVLKVQPGSVDARLLQASVDTLEKKFTEAEREFNALLKELPDNAHVHLRTGLYYQVRGMVLQAEKNLLRALELEPDSNEILEDVAQFYVFQGKADQALKVIHDTVPDVRKGAFHYELMGSVYSGARRPQDAEAAYKKALQVEPDRVNAKASLATEYIEMQRYDEALTQIDDLLKQMPGNASAYMMKGMIYQAKENLEQAKDNYDQALKLDPTSYVAANNLAFLLAEEGRFLEVALTWAQAARRLRPNEPNSADTLGWVQHKLGRSISAREQLQFAVSKQPDNPTFQYHLAMIYKETKQVAQAQAALRKALSSKAVFKQRNLAEAELRELSQAN
jgi:tetratricopeptide (TPR) repeat protein